MRRLLALLLLLAVAPALAASSGSRHFNGTQIAHVGAAVITAAPFSMACWFRVAAPTDANAHPIMGVYRSSGGAAANFDGWRLQLDNTNVAQHLFLYTNTGASTFGQAESTNTIGATVAWHHAFASIASATSRFVLLDGTGQGSDATSITPAGVNDVSIGASVDDAGALDNAAVNTDVASCGFWNAALTVAEGAQLAKGADPRSIRPQALLLCPQLLGLTSPETELCASGKSWTLVGPPTVTASAPPVAPVFHP